MDNNKNFSRYAPKELEYMALPDRQHVAWKKTVSFWKNTALIGWTLAILTAFHAYVLPHLI